jgi:TolA-binding protein
VSEETEVEEPTEVPVEAEKVAPQTTTAKKIVKTTTEEQHFSKLEAKITELEAKITELSKVEEVVEEVVELEEVKPIKHNPENKSVNNKPLTPLERFRDIKSRMNG